MKKKQSYSLSDFRQLAFQFAVRNERVMALIKVILSSSTINKNNIDELHTYGINFLKDDRGCYDISDLDMLYDNGAINTMAYDYMSCIYLIKPKEKSNKLVRPIPIEKVLNNIHSQIETRGGKLNRLMSGESFEHYDAVTFKGQTVYSLDPSTNKKNTIKSDIAFIKEWINPAKYLQLLPA